MGVATSRVADLLVQMGWPKPVHAQDFDFSNLQSYLEYTNLEISLPRHAPQCDISIGDRKAAMYPRPSFCHEGYKMHLALLGPSTAAKKQFTEFIPKMANVFQGPSQKLAPGRNAVPHHFMDPELHRVVLWELPEINFKQSAENYIRELGLLYIDVVFLLFSDKYLLTDVYCKLVVAMAIHGVPFFVICTQSSDDVSEQEMQRIKREFMQKDVQGIRIFNPKSPQRFIEEILLDFVKEISWDRGKASHDQGNVTEGVSETILGQTVRLKNLEKKPELNGRLGVCIGYNKDTDRYLARITTDGVEQDISLKESSFSILKPKLVKQVVRVKGLEKKPELNGRFGFVDEFLRESERYRVFLPDRPGRALVLALKPENLEKMESVRGAAPISVVEPEAKPSTLPSRTSSDPSPKAASPTSPAAKASPTNNKSFDPPARDKPSNERPSVSTKSSTASSPGNEMKAEASSAATPPAAKMEGEGSSGEAETLTQLFEAEREKDKERKAEGNDLMSRIFEAETEPKSEDVNADSKEVGDERQHQTREEPLPPSRPRLQLSLHGLLGMRVWAVIGDPDEAEDIIDHLMDCGKTVFSISGDGGAHFASTSELDSDPSLPKTEVLAFIDTKWAEVSAVLQAKHLSLRGVILHPEASAYSPDLLEACRSAGMTVHSADVFSEVQPGAGLPVAPLD